MFVARLPQKTLPFGYRSASQPCLSISTSTWPAGQIMQACPRCCSTLRTWKDLVRPTAQSANTNIYGLKRTATWSKGRCEHRRAKHKQSFVFSPGEFSTANASRELSVQWSSRMRRQHGHVQSARELLLDIRKGSIHNLLPNFLDPPEYSVRCMARRISARQAVSLAGTRSCKEVILLVPGR